MDNESLATELLAEIKKSARRWFIISMVELAILCTLIILLFVVPAEVTEEYTYSQGVEDITDSTEITQRIGDDYGESNTDGN